MKKTIRKLLIFLLGALVVIQFIRPAKNISKVEATNDISSKFILPDSIKEIFKVACYDCHSNHSRYPWYWNIQPVAWFLDGHIREGKRHLNFSIFTSYRIGRQYKIFDNISKEVKSGDMPLNSYTLIHRDADLTDAQKLAIISWAAASRKQLEASYPPDSLKTPTRVQPGKPG